MSNKRNRTPSSEYIDYGLYWYFLVLSLRKVVKASSYLHIFKGVAYQSGSGSKNFIIESYHQP
ncbi:MAG TPA: hypothetical protein VFG45_09350 [Candidatus Nitrosocosmicus sp.]|nr:hypothetical protein [Candidatus Nitrosocosmicus sp.]